MSNSLKQNKLRLAGEKYYLETLQLSDVSEVYLNWLSDPDVNRFLEVRHLYHTKDTLKTWVNSFDNKNKYLFGIYTLAEERQIGTATLYDISFCYKIANYGYLIGDKNFWGQGVLLEVLSKLFDFAFFEIELRKLTTHGYVENISTIINYKKFGLVQEGYLKDHVIFENKLSDCVIYSLFKENWVKRRKELGIR